MQDFIGTAPWDHRPLITVLVGQVVDQLGEPDGIIAFDPSSFPKRGTHSVGVKRQWCSHRGKVDNCQVGVFMGYVSRHDHALLDFRLSLPQEWARDERRRQACHVPEAVSYRTRYEQCLEMLDLWGAQVPHGWMTGDDELGCHFVTYAILANICARDSPKSVNLSTGSEGPFETIPARKCPLPLFALGQRLRHFADHVAHTAGTANSERVRRWFQDKKAGWYAVLADPQMPATSTLLDQAHNAIERKLFAMKGFHHPKGSQQVFLTGLAHLYNLVPYQRRAQHAGQCGVEVEGGRVPTHDWFLNLQILTSGGFR